MLRWVPVCHLGSGMLGGISSPVSSPLPSQSRKSKSASHEPHLLVKNPPHFFLLSININRSQRNGITVTSDFSFLFCSQSFDFHPGPNFNCYQYRHCSFQRFCIEHCVHNGTTTRAAHDNASQIPSFYGMFGSSRTRRKSMESTHACPNRTS